MNIRFDISEAEAKWGVDTIKRIGTGIATEGVGLPSALGASFVSYLRDVRSVTPPARGETVGSVALRRGKLAISVDLRRAFRIVAPNSKLAVGFDRAWGWYHSLRGVNGRPRVTVKLSVTPATLRKIEMELHKRVGYLQAGWNAASTELRQSIPSWVNKSAPSKFTRKNTGKTFSMQAINGVRYSGDIPKMQRAINYAQRRATQRLEQAAKEKAESVLNQNIKP